MSQAVAMIFAEYFEIEPEVNYSGGLLADRVRDLESKVSSLGSLDYGLLSSLLSRVERLEEKESRIESSSGSGSEPLEIEPVFIEKNQFQQLTTFDIEGDGLIQDFVVKELNGQELAKLLKVGAAEISTKKTELTLEGFIKWTKTLKGNSSETGWGYRKKPRGNGVLYYPVNEPLA